MHVHVYCNNLSITGNVAFIFAIVAIFFGMKYGSINMPETVNYLLIAYVIVHVLIHLALTTQRCQNQVKDINDTESVDAPGSGFRKSCGVFYILMAFGFATALTIWILVRRNYV